MVGTGKRGVGKRGNGIESFWAEEDERENMFKSSWKIKLETLLGVGALLLCSSSYCIVRTQWGRVLLLLPCLAVTPDCSVDAIGKMLHAFTADSPFHFGAWRNDPERWQSVCVGYKPNGFEWQCLVSRSAGPQLPIIAWCPPWALLQGVFQRYISEKRWKHLFYFYIWQHFPKNNYARWVGQDVSSQLELNVAYSDIFLLSLNRKQENISPNSFYIEW